MIVYVGTIEGESKVTISKESDDNGQTCDVCEKMHRTPALALRCAARWYRREAKRLARQARILVWESKQL